MGKAGGDKEGKKMKRRRAKRVAPAALFALGAALGTALGTGGVASRAEDGAADVGKRPVVAENRWAIVLDASRPSASTEAQARIDAAREKFRADLEASGILPDHIFVYTSTSEDETRRPTRATILNVLNALRDVDGVCELYPTGPDDDKPYWREVVDEESEGADAAPCEVQLYLTAPGFAAPDGERDWLVPCDAALENLDAEANADRLLSVAEIEDALSRPLDEDATPIQRTFLAVNFLTIEAATRGSGGSGSIPSEVDLERSIGRGFGDSDSTPSTRFQHVRVSTKNERWDATTVDSFYATMSEGLTGCADLAGDRDGWVEAGELAEYVRANGRDDAVAIAQNGNAVYALCPSRREWSVPAALYSDIERIFTRPEYKKLRDSAKARREQVEAEKRGGAKR